MKTTTKKTTTKKNPFTLAGMIDKQDVADNLACITGDDDLAPLIFFERDLCIRPDGRTPDEASEGHVFRVELEGTFAEDILLDDRKGDLRLLLADALEHRAHLLEVMAAHYRDHAKAK